MKRTLFGIALVAVGAGAFLLMQTAGTQSGQAEPRLP